MVPEGRQRCSQTHLVLEQFAVATPRALLPAGGPAVADGAHPVGRFVAAHVEGTLNINDMAANGLIKEGTVVANVFPPHISVVALESPSESCSHDTAVAY